ncbi:hypothetical protein RF679_06135 [Undibacterium cyanobacteriorum]|uniref:Pyrrolo-quinoline quinone n=1 Tax=Undibacterium cyanobacteriorum TaxID=3073561 RepID=A0ABY9RM09_9BURK|nr:hypothetical protein [Undibacterium sp. 20NA77.5]WMW81859.1 hypothetical protein RF679_06135 [Undibacterium sp. 20NA77.5]
MKNTQPNNLNETEIDSKLVNLKNQRRSKLLFTSVLTLCAAAIVVACGGSGSSSAPSNGGSTGGTNPGGGTSTGTGNGNTTVVGPPWLSFGGNPQHEAVTTVATQSFGKIAWQTPVDLAPQYSSQGYLLVHYGSPVITAKNTVILPVKTSAGLSYRFEARDGATGDLIWSETSDYVMPSHRWTPTYNVTIAPNNKVYAAGAGGKVLYRDDADAKNGTTKSIVFYGDTAYNANKTALDAAIIINTPITADVNNNVYFGFTATPGNPAGLVSGVARIGSDGKTSWVSTAAITGNTNISKVATNSAIAVSRDGKTIYVVANNNFLANTRQTGSLLALDSGTLALKSSVQLIDPLEKGPANVSDDSTASPLVGPDGDVYIGVLEKSYGTHNARGWLLHFNADLSQSKTPGSFGWDDTPSIVPASIVPSYKGASTYLLMVKYNNYERAGSGDGMNQIAIIDPHTEETDKLSTVKVMKEVLTMLGPTPDPAVPGGFIEWCVNTAAVDPFTKSVIVNSEDGNLYRWDLTTNKLTEKIRLTSGLGESYTPTAVGPDGKVYAINNAVVFAVGK